MSAYARWEDPNRREPFPCPPAVDPNAALLRALGSKGELVATIDFETYWETGYTLRGQKSTVENYVRDPRFEVIGVGVKFGAHPTVWLEEWEFREWAARVDWSRVAVCAHQAHFDGLILSHHYGVKPRFWLCTLSMARVLHGSGGIDLAHLGPRYGLGEKGTELKNTKGKRRANFTQAEWLLFGEYCKQDVTLAAGVLEKMRRGFPETELWLIDTTIRAFTEPIFRGDEKILAKARDDERERKRKLLTAIATEAGLKADDPVEAARALLASNDKFAELLRSMGEEPPQKTSKTTGKPTWAFAKDDPGMQALLEHGHERDDIRTLAETRLAVKSTIIETRAERILGAAQRGAVPFYLKYAGAHTHRWSGGDKMNPQNFNRGGDLRDSILAPEGMILAVADSSQIEARTIGWLAGSRTLLETFRRNDRIDGDFYSDIGSTFFLKKISKKETPVERQLSKNMVLGLGFEMGWGKFATELLKGMLGSDPVQFTENEARKFGVDVSAFEARQHGRSGHTCGALVEKLRKAGIRLGYRELLVHCAVADHFVRLYRSKNPEIVNLWRTMQKVLEVMGREGDDGVRMTYGPLKIRRNAIEKPNGLVLRYPGLRKAKEGWVYQGGHAGRKVTKIYGGLLTENVVQSLARDVVGEQVLWVRAKYATAERRSPIGTTTHDEIVAVVPKAQGAACLAYMKERMRKAPEWCRDLPLNATGAIGERYGDAK